jgi:hypothetical protein
VICGTFSASNGFRSISPRSQLVLDIFLSHDLYFLTMVEGVNGNKDTHSASSAEKQFLFILIFVP